MKRSKPTNLGSNDKLTKPYKRFKSGVASHDLSPSNGDTRHPSKEVRNPPVGQTIDKTKNLLRGKRTPAKQDKSAELKHPRRNPARMKGKLSADSRGPKALLKGDLTLTTPNIVKEKHVTKNIRKPVVMGLQCNALTVCRSKKSKQLTSESPQNVGVPLALKTTGNQVKETNGATLTIRKSGRTFRKLPKTGKTSFASIQHSRDASAKKLSNRRRTELTLQQEKSDKPVKGLNTKSLPQDLQDLSTQNENGHFGADVETSLDALSEDQPLSRWLAATLESAGKRTPGNLKLPPSITNGNDQNLIFEKRSSLWETIESMEAFRLFPQKPHFRPLENLQQNARERHAIYKMVDFLRVFEETCRLRVDHPRTEVEGQLETLSELEAHGFDVDSIRNRLIKMLSFKDEREGLETRSKSCKDNVVNERVKVEEHNREIDLINKQVDALLSQRNRALKEKEETVLKIVALEEDADKFEEAKRECRCKFDALASAPFNISGMVS